MSEKKVIKIDLPDGTVEASGTEDFINRFRKALVYLLNDSGNVQSGGAPAGDVAVFNVTPSPSAMPKKATIRDLYNEKRPVSNSQVAALVAYYLSEVASGDEKQDWVDSDIIEKYFKLCPHELPKKKAQVLPNAKRDGYLESIGSGKYKLNAIGYNLIVHGLPSGPKSAPMAKIKTVRSTQRIKSKRKNK